jgi:hypothetical protein
MYERFQILLDGPAPADNLGLNFDDYAAALAEIIVHSQPQFAVGIFGVWGSGKTTLMRAVEHNLTNGPFADAAIAAGQKDVIPVWFNAWRYEKEPHLIIPLLDTIREAFVTWVDEHPTTNADDLGRAMKVASMMSRAAHALLAGLTIKAGVPGAVEASLDANKAVTAWKEGADPVRSKAQEPQSFYHASFLGLRAAVEQFGQAGAKRIVVFVDDLDRCLPTSALDVLESMKLFFDLSGFVFVVGLDDAVIVRAVEEKYGVTGDGAAPAVSGANYIKKIFQVPFSVPRIDQVQLNAFLEAVIAGSDLDPEQQADLRTSVWPHLPALTGDGTVNPREVKRFVNAYTMQMKMLERKLRPAQPVANIVLALQALYFREDWRRFYDLLVSDPTDFQQSIADAVKDGDASLTLGAEVVPLPASLRFYLAGPGNSLLTSKLDVYVSSLETAVSSNPAFLEVLTRLGQLRRALANHASPTDIAELLLDLARHQDRLSVSPTPASVDLTNRFIQIRALAERLPMSTDEVYADLPDQITGMEIDLRELRRSSGVGATSAA